MLGQIVLQEPTQLVERALVRLVKQVITVLEVPIEGLVLALQLLILELVLAYVVMALVTQVTLVKSVKVIVIARTNTSLDVGEVRMQHCIISDFTVTATNSKVTFCNL